MVRSFGKIRNQTKLLRVKLPSQKITKLTFQALALRQREQLRQSDLRANNEIATRTNQLLPHSKYCYEPVKGSTAPLAPPVVGLGACWEGAVDGTYRDPPVQQKKITNGS